MPIFLSLVLGTFVAEDLSCIAAGVLVHQGVLALGPAVSACTLGIFLGDVGLWVLGRYGGRAALAWPWIARRARAAAEVEAWLERHAGRAVVLGRFLPGTRLPLYVTAGFVRLPLGRFCWWALVGALLWTPPIVILTAWLGDVAAARLSALLGAWGVTSLLGLGVLALLHAFRRAWRPDWRARLARWSRWEFWPMWLFYAPVAGWVLLLALRYRGIATLTAANPGIPDGGTLGESKSAILSRLPAGVAIPTVRLDRGEPAVRVSRLMETVRELEWPFPLVLKPDVGQRGTGVRLVRSEDEALAYLTATSQVVLAQPYDEGPFEAGVFYYRLPSWTYGRIFSITDKHFPVAVGDGRSTLEQLIWAHPRHRLQAKTFLARHAPIRDRVLAAGERLQLAIAGNHAQGTLFRDGRHLWTPALERRIDQIARAFPGFFIGRFDIRYADVEEFKAGRGLAVVELNGATAESTNIYDPDGSLLGAYRQLFTQWALVFAIGAANRSRGAAVSSRRQLLSLVQAHLTTRVALQISD